MVRMVRQGLPLAYVASAMLAGCTFLIDFDAPEAPAEAGLDSAVPPGPPDVRIDGSGVEASVDAGADVRDAIANPDACKGNPDGKYCGGNQIVWPAANKDDLVTCKGQVVSIVKLCSGVGGCIRMANGFPDQCDECGTRADGFYCGRDLGWEPKNAERRVQCQNKASIAQPVCPSGCMTNGAASLCK